MRRRHCAKATDESSTKASRKECCRWRAYTMHNVRVCVCVCFGLSMRREMTLLLCRPLGEPFAMLAMLWLFCSPFSCWAPFDRHTNRNIIKIGIETHLALSIVGRFSPPPPFINRTQYSSTASSAHVLTLWVTCVNIGRHTAMSVQRKHFKIANYKN